MREDSRRSLLKKGGAMLAAGMLGGIAQGARAAEGDSRVQDRDCTDSLAVGAGRDRICATCRYWGGMRRLSSDQRTVTCETIGWCNNTASFNFHMVTTPGNGPLECWKKWEAL